MAPSAEAISDLKPKAIDFHDWRFGQSGQNGQSVQKAKNGQNGQYGRPILIKVEKSGKNSWSLKEVTAKEDGTGGLVESSDTMMTPPLLPESKGEKLGKGDRAGSLLASLSSSLSGEKGGEARLQKQKSRRYAWLLLLQAHKAAGCLAWLGMGARTFLRHFRKRLFSEKVSTQVIPLGARPCLEEWRRHRCWTGVQAPCSMVLRSRWDELMTTEPHDVCRGVARLL